MSLRGGALLTKAVLLILFFLAADRGMATTETPGGRYALVIGNTDYGRDEVSGRADARAMSRALREAGFTVLPLVTDADLGTMRDGLKALEKRISKASVVLVFYSGHGFRVGATSYLFPIGGTDSEDGSMKVEEITEAMKSAPADAVKLVFLDACRDIRELALPPGAEVAMAEILNPPQRVLYGFASEIGRKAVSGDSDSLSPYTEALLKFVREPGLEIRDFLSQVRLETFRLSSGRQSPADDGIGRMPKEFYLREPVYVNVKIDDVDDSMIVFLGNDIVLQGSEGEEHRADKLRLKARDNVLKLFVSNERTYRRNQSWERPEGWKYQFQVYSADGEPLICSEHTMAQGCFSGRERVPFKDGRRHGKLFQVAQVNLFVDPVTAKLTFKDSNDTLWSNNTPFHEQNQDVLFERKLFDLPLNRVLGDNFAALAVFILGFVAPDPNKILVTARGNLLAKEAVQRCMADEERWIRELRASVDRAIVHHPKPFEQFDQAVTDCVKAEAQEPPNSELPPDKIRIYTAVEDRHGEPEPASTRSTLALTRTSVGEPLPRGVSMEGDLLADLAELFSPVRPEQYLLAAVRASQEQLQNLSQTLLYASISEADLQAHLPASLNAQFKAGMGSGRAQVARVELRDQEIVVWTAFEISRPEARVSLFGEAEVHCAAAIERGAIVLRPSASTVHLTNARLGDGPLDLEKLTAFLGPLLRGFLGDVSHVLEIQRVPLRLEGMQSIDLASLLSSMGGVIEVNAQPAGINVGLGAAALLVDATGIHVLADAVVLTPERFAATVEQLRLHIDRNETPRFSSDQLAVLGECGQPLSLPASLSLTFADVCMAFTNLALTDAPTPTETPEIAETLTGPELDALRKAFRDKADSVEPDLPSEETLVALSRSEIVAGLNTILPGVVVQATLRPHGFQGEIPDGQRKIRTPLAPDLHCDQVGRPCSGIGLGRLGCELEKAAQQAGCRANQEWLNLVDGQEVGELQGRFDVRNIDLPLILDEVRVGTDFETIDLRLEATGGGEVSGQLSAQPLNAGHLICLAPWEASAAARVSLPRQQKRLQLRRTGAGLTPEEELRLTYELPETNLQLKIEPLPIQAFLDQNAARLALSCPVPTFVSAVLGGFPGAVFPLALPLRNEILRDNFDVPLPAQEIQLVIPSQTIPVGDGEPIRLVPSWGEKAILFEAR